MSKKVGKYVAGQVRSELRKKNPRKRSASKRYTGVNAHSATG
jgi:hypothetical protein